jgi:hypothetical protein
VLCAEWIARQAQPLWDALPAQTILDWDSTVQPKYGHQEGAERGYNPTKSGRRSFHPLLAVVARTRLCPAYRFRAGDTVTATQWAQTMEDAQCWLGDHPVWLNRGDLGLGQEAVMAWHEAQPERPKSLFKLKLTKGVEGSVISFQSMRSRFFGVSLRAWMTVRTSAGYCFCFATGGSTRTRRYLVRAQPEALPRRSCSNTMHAIDGDFGQCVFHLGHVIPARRLAQTRGSGAPGSWAGKNNS